MKNIRSRIQIDEDMAIYVAACVSLEYWGD